MRFGNKTLYFSYDANGMRATRSDGNGGYQYNPVIYADASGTDSYFVDDFFYQSYYEIGKRIVGWARKALTAAHSPTVRSADK